MLSPTDEAKRILSEKWSSNSIPVSPSRIAAALGVAVTADPGLDGSGHFDPVGLKNRPLITYNPNENIVRNRFTIAHELGHFVLNHGERDRYNNIDFTMDSRDRKEVDANKFAAYLLMPPDAVKAAITVSKINTVEELSSLFKVSKAAMRFRLKGLGYDV